MHRRKKRNERQRTHTQKGPLHHSRRPTRSEVTEILEAERRLLEEGALHRPPRRVAPVLVVADAGVYPDPRAIWGVLPALTPGSKI